MHQSESAADRKMAHPLYPRRSGTNHPPPPPPPPAAAAPGPGPGPGSGGASLGSLMGQPAPTRPHTDDALRSPALAACSGTGAGSVPAPPQTLSLHGAGTVPLSPAAAAAIAPAGPGSMAGAQMKKKSGFQITSVTPAQNNAGSNNSIAEDTESYDDMDESHTEDLSSSEILDVSRATDYEPERSSSEETLNNVGDAETPSAVSPNQPRLPPHQPALFNGPGMASAAPSGAGMGPPGNVTASVEKNGTGAPMPGLVSGSVGAPVPLASNIGTVANARTVSGMGSNASVGGTSVGASASVVGGTTGIIGAASSTVASTTAAVTQPAAGSSRFRVVKLDSSTEPYKKGRWVCTEFYDKENVTVLTEGASVNRMLDSVKQASVTDANLDGQSTGGGNSVSSTLSAVGYYIEAAGNGEPGLMPAPQQQAFQALCSQQLDFSSGGPLAQSVSQPQLSQAQLHSQDVIHSQQKPSAPLSGRAGISGVQQTPIQQQLPYSQQQQPSQTLSAGSQPQQLSYPQQQPASQMTTQHIMSSNTSAGITEYVQHPQMQPSAQPMQQSSSGLGVAAAPSGQPQHVQGQAQPVLAQAQSGQTPGQPGGHVSAKMPPTGAANGQLVTGQQGNTISLLQQSCPPSINKSTPIGLQPSAPPAAPAQQLGQPLQGGMVQQQASISGLVQQVTVAPPKQQLPSQPQGQGVECIIQSVNNQTITGISSTPSTVNTNLPNVGSNVSTSIPTAPANAVPQQTTTQTSVQNSLIQKASQPSVPANASLPVVQAGPQKMVPGSAHYSTPIQSLLNAVEDSRRPADQPALHVEQVAIGESVLSAASALVQEIASSANLPASASLLPLKTLPLSMQPVDGEDDRQHGRLTRDVKEAKSFSKETLKKINKQGMLERRNGCEGYKSIGPDNVRLRVLKEAAKK
ncbi:TSC22 domain family protein 1-like [Stegostoma tigrinum]|uniref:TSC22 domain family protein 1-like n=1 Tax=Stegostoma tigrinum TaxID=3053191 RepID=UPI0028708539|nr:TSC22 domain family protein 1-like [Stegostoma tigrinum]